MQKPFVILSWEKEAIPSCIEHICMSYDVNDFEHFHVIFPHARIQSIWERTMKRYLANQTFFLPNLYTMSSYINMLYSRYIEQSEGLRTDIRRYEEIILLYDVIEKNKTNIYSLYKQFIKLEASVQYSWLYTMLDCIHNCFLYNIDGEKIVFNNQDIHIDELYTCLPKLYTYYQHMLNTKRYNTPEYKIYRTVSLITSSSISYDNNIVLFGFPCLEGAEETLMKRFWEQGHVHIYLYNDTAIIKQQDTSLHTQWIQEWGAQYTIYPEENSPKKTISEHINIIECDHTHAELEYIQNICEQSKGQSIAIIPLDSSLLEPLLYYIEHTDVNVSIGFSLLHSGVAYYLQSIILLQKNRYSGFYHKDNILAVLEHPYSIHTFPKDSPTYHLFVKYVEAIKNSIDTYIDINSIFMENIQNSIDDINSIAKLKEYLDSTIIMWSNIASYNEAIACISKLIKNIDSISLPLSSIEQAALAYLKQHAIEYFSSTLEEYYFTQHTIYIAIEQYIQSQRIPFVSSHDHAIDIIGLSEMQMLSFDIVCFLGTLEGNLPHQEKENPLLPLYIKEQCLGIVNPVQQAQKEEYRFLSILHACHKAYILYSKGAEQQIGGRGERSRYIEKLLWQEEQKKQQLLETDYIQHQEKNQSLSPLSYREQTGDLFVHDVIKHRLQQGISYSMLNSYLTCPFQFFHNHILKLQYNEDTASNQTIGLHIHKILEDFFKQYRASFVTRDELVENYDKLMAMILPIIQQEAQFSIEERILTEYTIAQQFKRLLECQPDSFYIEALEVELTSTIHGYPLTGKIDRIDIREDVYYVVDYKTGRKKTSPTYYSKLITAIEEGYTFEEYLPILRKSPLQMLLYLYLLHKNYSSIESNASYYYLADQNNIEMMVKNTPFNEEMIIPLIEHIVGDIVQSLENISTLHCIRGNHCQYCSYKALCL